MGKRLILFAVLPIMVILAAFGTMQAHPRTAEAAISSPTGLRASSIGPGVVRFAWNPGTENIWYCVNVANSFGDLATGGPTWRNYGCWTTSSAIDVSGLGCDTTYYWNVYTWNTTSSTTSSSANFQTDSCSSQISPPTGLNASVLSSGAIRFDWNAGSNNVWYCVNTATSFADLATGGPSWRNFGCWTTATQIDVGGLPCGATIFWNVYTWNQVTSATSTAATVQSVDCSTIFTPPDDLEATNITDHSARLTWDGGLNNVWFCVNTAESEADLANGGPTWDNHGCWSTTESLNLTGLDDCTTYYWNVFSWNTITNGTSETASFTTTGSCPTPTPSPTATATSTP